MKTPEELAEEWAQEAAEDWLPDKPNKKNYVISIKRKQENNLFNVTQIAFTGPDVRHAFLAGYQAAKQQLQPQPFHKGADVYIIDANNPRPKVMPLSEPPKEEK